MFFWVVQEKIRKKEKGKRKKDFKGKRDLKEKGKRKKDFKGKIKKEKLKRLLKEKGKRCEKFDFLILLGWVFMGIGVGVFLFLYILWSGYCFGGDFAEDEF